MSEIRKPTENPATVAPVSENPAALEGILKRLQRGFSESLSKPHHEESGRRKLQEKLTKIAANLSVLELCNQHEGETSEYARHREHLIKIRKEAIETYADLLPVSEGVVTGRDFATEADRTEEHMQESLGTIRSLERAIREKQSNSSLLPSTLCRIEATLANSPLN